MPLGQAQLGQLPYINLARYVPEAPPREAAWHKALASFLVNAAGKGGGDLVSNALARDYTKDAVASKLAPEGTTGPTFWDQVIHGPMWSQQRLEEGQKEQAITNRWNNQTKLERDKMAQVDQERRDRLNESTRKHDQDQRWHDDEVTLRRHEAMDKNLTNLENNTRLNQQEVDRQGDREQTRRDEHARTQAYVDAENRRAAQAQAQQALLTKLLGGDQPQGQPSGNNDSVNFSSLLPTTPPGSSPTSAADAGVNTPEDMYALALRQSQTAPQINPVTAREAANRAPGGTASQPGQMQQMAPGTTDTMPPGVTQPQRTQQFINPGDPSSLVRPPATPNTPTGIQPSSASGYMPPAPDDPRIAAMLANLARIKMQPTGGLSLQAGAGGAPIGY